MHLIDWSPLLTQTFSTKYVNSYRQRKHEFQSGLVESTFDLKALASDLQQVETVSFQPIVLSAVGFLASTLCSLAKYYHFAEEYSKKKHGVDYMWGLRAHVVTGVNAVSRTSRGFGKVTECENKPNTCSALTNSAQYWEFFFFLFFFLVREEADRGVFLGIITHLKAVMQKDIVHVSTVTSLITSTPALLLLQIKK